MKTIGRKKARKSFNKLLVKCQDKFQIITRGKQPVAVVIGIDGLDLAQAQSLADSVFRTVGQDKKNGEQTASA